MPYSHIQFYKHGRYALTPGPLSQILIFGKFSGTLEHRFDNTKTVYITEGSFDILIQ
jgi:hypothetical protein